MRNRGCAPAHLAAGGHIEFLYAELHYCVVRVSNYLTLGGSRDASYCAVAYGAVRLPPGGPLISMLLHRGGCLSAGSAVPFSGGGVAAAAGLAGGGVAVVVPPSRGAVGVMLTAGDRPGVEGVGLSPGVDCRATHCGGGLSAGPALLPCGVPREETGRTIGTLDWDPLRSYFLPCGHGLTCGHVLPEAQSIALSALDLQCACARLDCPSPTSSNSVGKVLISQ